MKPPKGCYPDISEAPNKHIEEWIEYCKERLAKNPGVVKDLLQEVEVKMRLERARRIHQCKHKKKSTK